MKFNVVGVLQAVYSLTQFPHDHAYFYCGIVVAQSICILLHAWHHAYVFTIMQRISVATPN